MKKIHINDRHSYEITRREYTQEGYLKAPGRVARTGIQEYTAQELGLTDRKPDEILKIYRPVNEVFSENSLSSYFGVDVTDDHPPALIDKDTFKKYTVGTVLSKGKVDGDFVTIDVTIKDKSAIEAVESGKVQLSAGYKAEYEMTPGKTPDGQSYDGIQKDIKINHVAIVKKARAGAQARLLDENTNKTRDKKMPIAVLDNGEKVELNDKASAILVRESIDRLNEKVIAVQSKLDNALNDVISKEKEIEDLKSQLSEDSLNERVKLLAEAREAARIIVGDSFKTDSVSVAEIHKQALSIHRPNLNLDSKSVEYIAGVFDQTKEYKDQMNKKDMMERLIKMGMKEDQLSGMSMAEMQEKYDQMSKESKDGYPYQALTSNTEQTKDSDTRSHFEKFKETQANAWRVARDGK